MIKMQVEIPDELFERAERVAAAKEWSFAELVRRGLEQMTARQPRQGAGDGESLGACRIRWSWGRGGIRLRKRTGGRRRTLE